MANWYQKKTYYEKSIKCYQYALQLLMNQQKNKQSYNNSTNNTKQIQLNNGILKSDILFSLSLSQSNLSLELQSIEHMQQSYRLRVKSLGKNSIQSSHCLQLLSRWSFLNKNWQDCLHYAKQCYRVRKLNTTYSNQLQRSQKLLQQIYNQLQKQKNKNQQLSKDKQSKYYQTLTNNQLYNQQSTYFTKEPQQSFIKQLNSINKQQQIPFKVQITQSLAETLSSLQWEKLIPLLQIQGKLMDKEQIRRIIFQSEFTDCLNQQQKDIFIKVNRID